MRLVTGTQYEASISLNIFERMASNDTIKSKLEGAGFTGVIVWGSGSTRAARGVWSGQTQDADIPSQVKAVRIV